MAAWSRVPRTRFDGAPRFIFSAAKLFCKSTDYARDTIISQVENSVARETLRSAKCHGDSPNRWPSVGSFSATESGSPFSP